MIILIKKLCKKKIYSLLKMNPFDNINKKNVKTVNKGKLSAKNY